MLSLAGVNAQRGKTNPDTKGRTHSGAAFAFAN